MNERRERSAKVKPKECGDREGVNGAKRCRRTVSKIWFECKYYYIKARLLAWVCLKWALTQTHPCLLFFWKSVGNQRASVEWRGVSRGRPASCEWDHRLKRPDQTSSTAYFYTKETPCLMKLRFCTHKTSNGLIWRQAGVPFSFHQHDVSVGKTGGFFIKLYVNRETFAGLCKPKCGKTNTIYGCIMFKWI